MLRASAPHSSLRGSPRATPTPANLRWAEIEAVLTAVGAEITEGAGSRVRAALRGARAVFHRPHPAPEAKRAAVRAVRDLLTAAGVTPETEARDDA